MSKAGGEAPKRPTKILFVTWDGPQSSYLEGLFLPILSRLRDQGYEFHVLQFTWGDRAGWASIGAQARRGGIDYSVVKVLRRPVTLGSFATAAWGASHIVRLVRRHGIDMLMPRSILPALSTLIAMKALPGIKLLFDADGLPIDERIDFGGMSPKSPAAIILGKIEAAAVRRADAVLTRSLKAIPILQARAGAGTDHTKFFRVANCRDETLFEPKGAQERRRIREALGVPTEAPLIVNVGSSLTGKYRGDAMLAFFRMVTRRRPDSHFLLLTGDPETALALIRRVAPDLERSCHVLRAAPDQVPSYLSACDIGLALIEPKFSMQGSSLIKVGEYLLCGVPVIATRGVGDTDEILPPGVCFFLESNAPAELEAAADWFVGEVMGDKDALARAARRAGLKHYGLRNGVAAYHDALRFAERR